jgi:hypothetical protein
MSQTMFKKYGRWLCFFTLTLLFVAPPSSVAQDKNQKDGETLKKALENSVLPVMKKNAAQGFLSGKSTVHHRASAAPHVASTHFKWGCDPFSRCGK